MRVHGRRHGWGLLLLLLLLRGRLSVLRLRLLLGLWLGILWLWLRLRLPIWAGLRLRVVGIVRWLHAGRRGPAGRRGLLLHRHLIRRRIG